MSARRGSRIDAADRAEPKRWTELGKIADGFVRQRQGTCRMPFLPSRSRIVGTRRSDSFMAVIHLV